MKQGRCGWKKGNEKEGHQHPKNNKTKNRNGKRKTIQKIKVSRKGKAFIVKYFGFISDDDDKR